MMTDLERSQLAEAVRNECVRTALTAYEAARADGLCGEGAFEVAIDAMRGLDVDALGANWAGERRQ